MVSKQEFKSIYNNNHNKVYRLCMGYVTGDSALAEDLTQEVFVKVWEKMDSFRNDSEVSTWIYRITVNTCLMHLRKLKRKTETLSYELPVDIVEPVDEDNTERLSALRKCMQKLNEIGKLLISLQLEGVAQKEISEITGLSNENVRVKVHRVKGQLFKCMTSKKY